MRESHRDQCAVIKFYYCLQKKLATKTYEKMKALYGDECFTYATLFSWHKMFSIGRESMELQHVVCSGHPTMVCSKVNVNTVGMLIKEDHSITCHDMAANMNCCKMLIKEDHSITCHDMAVNMNCCKMSIKNIVQYKLWMGHVASTWVLLQHYLTLVLICKDTDQVEATDKCIILNSRYFEKEAVNE